MGKTFWGVVSAAVEQSRRKVNMVAQGDGKFGRGKWRKKEEIFNKIEEYLKTKNTH